MTKRAVLAVDDDETVRSYLSHSLSSRGFVVEAVASGEQAIARLSAGYNPAVVILDLIMEGMSGRETLSRIKSLNPSVPVIVVSGIDELRSAVEVMKMGASDYLVKPFEDQELDLALENVLEKQELKEEVKNLRRQLHQYVESDFVTANAGMLRIKETARQLADADVPVLLLGESGVGKEVVGRFIHAQSKRRDKPFIKVNCAALPHDLLESELFGYERGAFTGALNEKPGKFELADKGFILLDEIGEMSSVLQAKLLHVLQDGEYSRLGSKRSVRVDARVLASTNRKLAEAVAKGEFREDLYYRLNVITLDVPPLRERKEDIPFLCNYFMQKYLVRYNSSVQELPAELMDVFLRHHWPGNIRELENAIKRYLILPDLEMALAEFRRTAGPTGAAPVRGPVSLKSIGAQAAEHAERELVLRTLDETNWNRKAAARRLGVCYKALLNKLKRWQIDGHPRNPPLLAKTA
ncbi:MAG: sigma-54 dependent transcriptional regulator [Acidobacteria bacterium]|nr:sigma-54 dependent transcriptional regulator [Acidobacteriota bacterium]